MSRELNEEELLDLYAWIDRIPLARPKRHITRDFSDGGKEVAELAARVNGSRSISSGSTQVPLVSALTCDLPLPRPPPPPPLPLLQWWLLRLWNISSQSLLTFTTISLQTPPNRSSVTGASSTGKKRLLCLLPNCLWWLWIGIIINLIYTALFYNQV